MNTYWVIWLATRGALPLNPARTALLTSVTWVKLIGKGWVAALFPLLPKDQGNRV